MPPYQQPPSSPSPPPQSVLDAKPPRVLPSSTTQSSAAPSNSQSSSAAAQSALPPPPREVAAGLANLGNTCYINASMQALAHAPELCMALDTENHVSYYIEFDCIGVVYCLLIVEFDDLRVIDGCYLMTCWLFFGGILDFTGKGLQCQTSNFFANTQH